MTTARVRGLIDALPPGLTEIYLHPATHGDFAGAAPDYHYAEELSALIAPEVVQAIADSQATLGGFGKFAH